MHKVRRVTRSSRQTFDKTPLFSLSLFNRLYVARSNVDVQSAISQKQKPLVYTVKSDSLNLHMIVEKARLCILIIPQKRIGGSVRRCVTQSWSECLMIRSLIHSHLLKSQRGPHLTETFYTTWGVPEFIHLVDTHFLSFLFIKSSLKIFIQIPKWWQSKYKLY